MRAEPTREWQARGVDESNEGERMMNKHTQEKWVFNDNTLFWIRTPYSVTCRKPGQHSVTIAAIRNLNSIPDEEKRANALLITAAPDLLSALQGMVEYFVGNSIDDYSDTETMQAVHAAIAKAKGQV